jgi:CBS domain-containing protein
MTVQAQTTLPEGFQEIRTLHVVSGGGQAADLRSVRCPSELRSVPLEACLSCPECGGLVPASLERAQHVSCRSPRAFARSATPAAGSETRTPAERTPVSAVMTTRVLAVRPDVSLEALGDLFLDRGIGGAPVVDEEGHAVGMVSKTDFLRDRLVTGDTGEAVTPGWQPSQGRFRLEMGAGMHLEAQPSGLVADVMTPTAFVLSESAPVAQAAALMAFEGIHRVPVIGDDERVVGIVTSIDIMRWLAQAGGYLSAAGLRGEAPRDLPGASA